MRRVALMAGVDRYEDGAFRNLRYSVADAAALAAAFGRLGFETHVATNPGTAELLKEVKRRTAGLGPGDVFLFFFAGHGYTGPGGEHLLICSDDELAFLRLNRAGVPVALLEELTNRKGFHRAFLLDACRTDVFAGRAARGTATRDLALVALPDASENPGTCCVVRSCDRFCPALEYEDLGHGVFTQAVLDLLDGPEGRTLRMGEEFVGGLRRRMSARLRDGDSQNPHLDSNGEAFALFGEAASAPAARPDVSAPVLAVCPACGKKNSPENTFKCRECGRDDLCLRHQDATTFLCSSCMEERRRKAVEAERARLAREREEAEKRASEAYRLGESRRIAELERKLEETRRQVRQGGGTSPQSEQFSSRKRGTHLLIGLFLGWLGLHFAYAGRWFLFGLHWVVLILLSIAADANADAMGIPLTLAFLGLWIGGTFLVGKDGHGKKMQW